MTNHGFRGKAALPLTIILLLLTACDGDELQSHRPMAGMVIDGNGSDWQTVPTHQVKEMEGLVVGVANDDDYLYLLALSSDLRLARRLRMLGIIVQASGAGPDGSELLLRYHGSVALSDNLMRAGGGPGGGRMPMLFETGEGSGLPVPGMIYVEQGRRVVRLPENRSGGPAAGSDVDGDEYCYEFRLPLEDLFDGPAREGGLSGQKVRVKLECGRMTKEMRQQMILLRNSGSGASGMGGDPRTLAATIRLAGPA